MVLIWHGSHGRKRANAWSQTVNDFSEQALLATHRDTITAYRLRGRNLCNRLTERKKHSQEEFNSL